MLILYIIFLLIVIFFIWASADINSQVYVKSLCRKKTSQKIVALTFDDGPDEDHTLRVLETLGKHKVKATFFLIGEKAEKNPQIVEKIVKAGHTIGIHTFSHSSLSPFYSKNKYLSDEIIKSKDLLEKIVGKSLLLFRPPFGVTNPIISKATQKLISIGWSIRTFDTISFLSHDFICKNIEKRIKCGDIILLHDRCKGSEELTERIISILKNKGFEFQTVDTLFQIKAYYDQ